MVQHAAQLVVGVRETPQLLQANRRARRVSSTAPRTHHLTAPAQQRTRMTEARAGSHCAMARPWLAGPECTRHQCSRGCAARPTATHPHLDLHPLHGRGGPDDDVCVRVRVCISCKACCVSAHADKQGGCSRGLQAEAAACLARAACHSSRLVMERATRRQQCARVAGQGKAKPLNTP